MLQCMEREKSEVPGLRGSSSGQLGQDLAEHHQKHHSCAEAEGVGWRRKSERNFCCSPLADGSFLNRCVSMLWSGQVQPGGDSRRELQMSRTMKQEIQPWAEHPTAELWQGMPVHSGKGSSGAEAEKLMCLTKLNKPYFNQGDSLPAWKRAGTLALLKILCCWLKTWTAARIGRIQDPGGWSSSAVDQTTALLKRKRTINAEGLADLERVYLMCVHLTHVKRKRRTLHQTKVISSNWTVYWKA